MATYLPRLSLQDYRDLYQPLTPTLQNRLAAEVSRAVGVGGTSDQIRARNVRTEWLDEFIGRAKPDQMTPESLQLFQSSVAAIRDVQTVEQATSLLHQSVVPFGLSIATQFDIRGGEAPGAISDLYIGASEAAYSYDPSKGGFAHYSASKMYGAIKSGGRAATGRDAPPPGTVEVLRYPAEDINFTMREGQIVGGVAQVRGVGEVPIEKLFKNVLPGIEAPTVQEKRRLGIGNVGPGHVGQDPYYVNAGADTMYDRDTDLRRHTQTQDPWVDYRDPVTGQKMTVSRPDQLMVGAGDNPNQPTPYTSLAGYRTADINTISTPFIASTVKGIAAGEFNIPGMAASPTQEQLLNVARVSADLYTKLYANMTQPGSGKNYPMPGIRVTEAGKVQLDWKNREQFFGWTDPLGEAKPSYGELQHTYGRAFGLPKDTTDYQQDMYRQEVMKSIVAGLPSENISNWQQVLAESWVGGAGGSGASLKQLDPTSFRALAPVVREMAVNRELITASQRHEVMQRGELIYSKLRSHPKYAGTPDEELKQLSINRAVPFVKSPEEVFREEKISRVSAWRESLRGRLQQYNPANYAETGAFGEEEFLNDPARLRALSIAEMRKDPAYADYIKSGQILSRHQTALEEAQGQGPWMQQGRVHPTERGPATRSVYAKLDRWLSGSLEPQANPVPAQSSVSVSAGPPAPMPPGGSDYVPYDSAPGGGPQPSIAGAARAVSGAGPPASASEIPDWVSDALQDAPGWATSSSPRLGGGGASGGGSRGRGGGPPAPPAPPPDDLNPWEDESKSWLERANAAKRYIQEHHPDYSSEWSGWGEKKMQGSDYHQAGGMPWERLIEVKNQQRPGHGDRLQSAHNVLYEEHRRSRSLPANEIGEYVDENGNVQARVDAGGRSVLQGMVYAKHGEGNWPGYEEGVAPERIMNEEEYLRRYRPGDERRTPRASASTRPAARHQRPATPSSRETFNLRQNTAGRWIHGAGSTSRGFASPEDVARWQLQQGEISHMEYMQMVAPEEAARIEGMVNQDLSDTHFNLDDIPEIDPDAPPEVNDARQTASEARQASAARHSAGTAAPAAQRQANAPTAQRNVVTNPRELYSRVPEPQTLLQNYRIGNIGVYNAASNQIRTQSNTAGNAGDLVLGSDDVNRSINVFQTAMDTAVANVPSGLGPKEVVSTILNNVSRLVSDHWSKELDRLDRPEDRSKVSLMRETTTQLARRAATSMAQASGIGEGAGDQMWRLKNAAGFRESDPETVRRVVMNDQKMMATLQRMYGGTPEEAIQSAMAGPAITLEGQGDNALQIGQALQGGGGGGSQYRGRRRPSFWEGPAGQLMYGAYIGGRLWTRTGGAVTADIGAYETYASNLGSLAALGTGQIGGGAYGAAGIRASGARFQQQAAFEQFGGFGAARAMLQGAEPGAGARMWQSAKMGLGAAAMASLGGTIAAGVGAELTTIAAAGGVGAGLSGLAGGALTGAASTISGLALPALAVMAGGALLMEGYNAIAQPETPLTFGNAAKEMASDRAYRQAMQAAGIQPEYFTAMDKNREWQLAQHGMTDKDLWQYMTPNQEAIHRGDAIAKSAKASIDLAEWISMAQTGEAVPSAQTQNAVITLDRMLGGVGGREDQIKNFAERAASAGYSFSDATAAAANIAGSRGIQPGQANLFTEVMDEWAGTDEVGRLALMEEAANLSAMGGQIGAFFSSGSMAQRAVSGAGFSNRAQLAPLQAVMTAASGQDFNMEQITGWDWQARGPSGPVQTLGSEMAQFMADAGTKQGAIIAPVASRLMTSGMDPMAALRAVTATTSGESTAFSTIYDQARQFGQMSTQDAMLLNAVSPGLTGYQGQQIAGLNNRFMSAGLDGVTGIAALGGFSGQQLGVWNRAAGGDLSAVSYLSRIGGDSGPGLQFVNEAGRPIYENDMGAFLQTGRNVLSMAQETPGFGGAANLPGFQALAGVDPNADLADQMEQFLGTGDAEAAQAWADGGLKGRTALHRERMFGYQMAGIGLGLEKIAWQRNYLWGQDSGGSWRSPTADSMFGLQDQMRALQHQSQQEGFAFSTERMITGNEFSIEREQLTQIRMDTSQQYQNWTMAFGRAQTIQGRTWTQEDWAFQDMTSELQYGWQMEDMDEAIRFSSGRQRRTLETKKERAVMTKNIADERTSTMRGRQQQLWAAEDERFQKQVEYTKDLQALDQESFEMGVSQRETFFEMDKANLERQIEVYEQSHAIQEKMWEKQRENTAKQLEFQERQLGIQAAAAIEQKKYAEEVEKVKDHYAEQAGTYSEMMKNDPTAILEALRDAMIAASGVNVAGLNQFAAALENAGDIDSAGIFQLRQLLTNVNNINYSKTKMLTNLFSVLD